MRDVSTIGIDLAKNAFHAHGYGCVRSCHFPQETAASAVAGILCSAIAVRRGDGGLRRVAFLGTGDR